MLNGKSCAVLLITRKAKIYIEKYVAHLKIGLCHSLTFKIKLLAHNEFFRQFFERFVGFCVEFLTDFSILKIFGFQTN
jgi:hypothetical protein